jgi:hypothetical protein
MTRHAAGAWPPAVSLGQRAQLIFAGHTEVSELIGKLIGER